LFVFEESIKSSLGFAPTLKSIAVQRQEKSSSMLELSRRTPPPWPSPGDRGRGYATETGTLREDAFDSPRWRPCV